MAVQTPAPPGPIPTAIPKPPVQIIPEPIPTPLPPGPPVVVPSDQCIPNFDICIDGANTVDCSEQDVHDVTVGAFRCGPDNRDLIAVIKPGENFESFDDDDVIFSAVVDVEFFHKQTGQRIQPFGEFELCLYAPEAEQEDTCLASYDGANAQDGEWKCDDGCLNERDVHDEVEDRGISEYYCGRADHTTNFAILYVFLIICPLVFKPLYTLTS